MSFLLSFCARGFFVATVFPLSLIIIQPQENKIWLCIAIVFVVSVLGSIAKESALWKKSKTEYENKGVINLKEGRFSILQWLSVWNQEKSKKRLLGHSNRFLFGCACLSTFTEIFYSCFTGSSDYCISIFNKLIVLETWSGTFLGNQN